MPTPQRTAFAREAKAQRDEQRPCVTSLFESFDDPHEVTQMVRSNIHVDGEQRHAALRVVREQANDWWAIL